MFDVVHKVCRQRTKPSSRKIISDVSLRVGESVVRRIFSHAYEAM